MMKMIKLTAILLTLSVILSTALQAEQSRFPAAFREKMTGARPMALGGAYTAAAADPLALIWNPALLQNQASTNNIMIEHSQILDFVEYSFAGYTRRVNPLVSVGAGFLHNGDELMSESTVILGAAADLTLLSEMIQPGLMSAGRAKAGLNIKYFYSSFGTNRGTDFTDFAGHNHRVSGSAAGIGIDLGVGIDLTETDYFGTAVKNLFADVNWDSENEAGTAQGSYSESLPLEWILGYAREMGRWKLMIDLNKSLSGEIEDIFHGGVEYTLVDDVFLRGGYSQELVTADNKKFMAGIGANLKIAGWANAGVNFTYLIHNQWSDNDSILFSIGFSG